MMHEMTILKRLLHAVEHEAAAAGGKLVSCVVLEVGEGADVIPGSLDACWRTMKNGTCAQNATLDIRPVPLTARCRRCETEFHVGETDGSCPRCSAGDYTIISGNDVTVKELITQ